MAKTAITFAVAGLVTLVLPWSSIPFAEPRVLAQDTDSLSFSVENYTSFDLVEFYIAPSGADSWSNNYLEDGSIPPRAARLIVVDDHREDCLYDVLGVFDDGEYAEEYEVDLCEIDGGNYAFYDENDAVFSIENQSTDAIVEFYFTPESAEDWGENLFDSAESPFVLQPGASVDIPVDSAECVYDFIAVFADGDRLEQEGIDVCEEGASIVFTDLP